MRSNKVRIIGCKVIEKELLELLGGVIYPYELIFLDLRHHGRPKKLKDMIQSIIDSSEDCGCVISTYGLCGGALDGVKARDVPVVFPRVHDCIDLMLGSTERRRNLSLACGGTYFSSNGWVVEDGTPSEKVDAYKRCLGEEEGEALKEFIYGNYRKGLFIKTGVEDHGVIRRAKDSAFRMGWDHVEVAADLSILRRLLYMDWNSKDFIILKPWSEFSKRRVLYGAGG